MIARVTPYLAFDGQARDAIRLYESALGAKVESTAPFSQMPGEAPPEWRDRIMHSTLLIGGQRLHCHDAPPGMPVQRGDNVQVLIELSDDRELDRAFDALSKEGRVGFAPHDAFFGNRFAGVTDRFGVGWMLIGPDKRG